ncbi:hypothetical protein [Streptomyces coeruleorubidus]|uniref:hypothetical protein n=1 Tax=Streptomyces coeruleorubidus TaxID=116188 RepID=UPI0033BE3752
MDKYIAFVAAIVVYLFSPILTWRAQEAILGAIARSRGALKQVPPPDPPGHLTNPFIKNYVAFAIDAAQVVPAIILTGVAVILAVPNDWSPSAAALLLVLVLLVIIAVDAYILSVDPQQYSEKKWAGYSLVSLVGIVINLVGVTLVAIFD